MNTLPPPRPVSRPPLKYGTLTLSSRYLLSPLAGFTNLSFRRTVRRIGGVGLTTTDLVNARGLLGGSPKTLSMIETCAEEFPFAVQIFGSEPPILREAAQFLEARGVHSVDINMGCPVERITKNGSGASLMCRPADTIDLVRHVVEGVNIPVTVKMRLGWDSSQITAPKFAAEFEQVGVAAVAIHGRTRAQGFSGQVDRDGIRRVVEAVSQIPDRRQRGYSHHCRRGPHVRGDGLCGHFDRPRGAGQSVDLPAARPMGRNGPLRSARQLRGAARTAPAAVRLPGRASRHAIGDFDVSQDGPLVFEGDAGARALRARFQTAADAAEIEAALAAIQDHGPIGGDRTGVLPDLQVPVPSGPVERW